MQAKQLYDLQQIDAELASAEEELAGVRSRLSDESAILSAKSELEEITDRLTDLMAKRRAADGIVTDLQSKTTNLESKLYSGSIKNPKEVAAVEEERQFTVNQQEQEEEKLLVLMVNLEEMETAQASGKSELERLEEARPLERVELQKSQERLEAEIAKFQEERGDIVPHVRSDLVTLYDSLRQTKKGQAVAKVERGMCQGCRLTLPQSEVQRARSATGVVQCNSCRRILFVG